MPNRVPGVGLGGSKGIEPNSAVAVRSLRMMHVTRLTCSLAATALRKKRNLFDELMEGFDALADQRAGKRTLRTHVVKPRPAPQIV